MFQRVVNAFNRKENPYLAIKHNKQKIPLQNIIKMLVSQEQHIYKNIFVHRRRVGLTSCLYSPIYRCSRTAITVIITSGKKGKKGGIWMSCTALFNTYCSTVK